MSVIQVEAHLSAEELLKAVEQLSEQELEQFFDKIVKMRAQQSAPRLSLQESELIARINQPMALDIRQLYDDLMAKRRASSLTEKEYEELLRLTNEVEKSDAERVRCLVELASIRNLPIDDLMNQLGIQALPYE